MNSLFEELPEHKPAYAIKGDFVDRLHSKRTFYLFIAIIFFIGLKQFDDDGVIFCWLSNELSGDQVDYAHKLCWVNSTYYYPGYHDADSFAQERKYAIPYYQYILFILIAQAFSFYLPNQVWKYFISDIENNIRSLVEDADNVSYFKQLAEHLCERKSDQERQRELNEQLNVRFKKRLEKILHDEYNIRKPPRSRSHSPESMTLIRHHVDDERDQTKLKLKAPSNRPDLSSDSKKKYEFYASQTSENDQNGKHDDFQLQPIYHQSPQQEEQDKEEDQQYEQREQQEHEKEKQFKSDGSQPRSSRMSSSLASTVGRKSKSYTKLSSISSKQTSSNDEMDDNINLITYNREFYDNKHTNFITLANKKRRQRRIKEDNEQAEIRFQQGQQLQSPPLRLRTALDETSKEKDVENETKKSEKDRKKKSARDYSKLVTSKISSAMRSIKPINRVKHLVFYYFSLKVFNVCNILIQFYFLNQIFGNDFYTLGIEFINRVFLASEPSISVGPDSTIFTTKEFPIITFCDFYVHKNLRQIHFNTAQCLLHINVIIEKFYIIVWFWLVILLAITVLNIFSWIYELTVCSVDFLEKYLTIKENLIYADQLEQLQNENIEQIQRSKKTFTKREIRNFQKEILGKDGVLMLHLVKNISGPIIFMEILHRIWIK